MGTQTSRAQVLLCIASTVISRAESGWCESDNVTVVIPQLPYYNHDNNIRYIRNVGIAAKPRGETLSPSELLTLVARSIYSVLPAKVPDHVRL